MNLSRLYQRWTESAVAPLAEKWAEDCAVLLASPLTESSKTGRVVEVAVVVCGRSKNSRVYTPEVLKKSIPIFEDMNVFIHKFDPRLADHLPDSLRRKFPDGVAGNMIGFLENVRYDSEFQNAEQRKQGVKGALIADFHVADQRMRDIFKNLAEMKRLDKLGFSIDVEGTVVEGPLFEGLPTKLVASIDKGYSLDVVTNPAAGGQGLRLLASEEEILEQTDLGRAIRKMREKKEITTEELGRRSGVDAGTINDIEQGRIKRPPDARLARIARVLGVSLAHIKTFIPKTKRQEEAQMKDQMIAFIKAFAPHILEGQELASLTDEQLVGFMRKAVETLAEKMKEKPLGEAELQEALHGNLMKALDLLKEGKTDEAIKVIQAVIARLPKEGAPYRAPGRATASQAGGEGDGDAAGPGDGKQGAGDGTPAAKAKEDSPKEEPVPASTAAAPAKVTESASKKDLESLNKTVADLKKDNEARALRESAAVLRAKLAESSLPMISRERIAAETKGKTITEADAEKRINAEKDYMAKLTDAGEIRGLGNPASSGVDMGMTESDRVQMAVDLLVDPDLAHLKEAKDKYKGVEPFGGLREAWTYITGDKHVRFNRSAMSPRMVEATTGSFPKIFGDSITRRLLREYRGFPQNWRKAVTVRPLADFRTQRPIRLGTFNDLAVVAEDAAFTSLNNPSEVETTYAAQKRGKKFAVTREMILADDLRKLRAFPSMIARAANRTLEKFVFALLEGSSGGGGVNTDLVSDGTAIYTVAHANLGTSPLDADSLRSSRIRLLLQQDEDSNETLGFMNPWLWLPIQLGPTGQVLINSEKKPGSANNDVNDNFKAAQPVMIPYFSDTNNWFLQARKEDIESIELGFVEGEEEPTLLQQDDPKTGDVFTNERFTWKVRHEYGGAVLSFQAFDGNIVP